MKIWVERLILPKFQRTENFRRRLQKKVQTQLFIPFVSEVLYGLQWYNFLLHLLHRFCAQGGHVCFFSAARQLRQLGIIGFGQVNSQTEIPTLHEKRSYFAEIECLDIGDQRKHLRFHCSKTMNSVHDETKISAPRYHVTLNSHTSRVIGEGIADWKRFKGVPKIPKKRYPKNTFCGDFGLKNEVKNFFALESYSVPPTCLSNIVDFLDRVFSKPYGLCMYEISTSSQTIGMNAPRYLNLPSKTIFRSNEFILSFSKQTKSWMTVARRCRKLC